MKAEHDKINISTNASRRRAYRSELDDVLPRTVQLFAAGHELDRFGFSPRADRLYQQAIDLLEGELQNGATLSGSKFARIAIQHGESLFTFRRFHEAANAFRRAVEVLENERVLGVNALSIELLARGYSWLGQAELACRRVDQSVQAFHQARTLWCSLLKFSPKGRADYCRRAIVATWFGASKALRILGKHELASQYRELAFELRKIVRN